jgi:GTP-binding protein
MGALRSTEDCDVAVLVLDATEAGVEQDARIAAIAEDKGRPLMVVVNKWDLKKGKVNEDTFREDLKFNFKWVGYAPFVFISAKQKLRVTKVLEIAKNLHEQANFRAPTPQLNKLLAHVTTEHPTPWVNGKATRLYYVAQVGVSPPAFAFTCNYPNAMPDRYKRYIENHLRATFGLSVPVRLFFRERPGKAKRDARIGRYRDASTKRRR